MAFCGFAGLKFLSKGTFPVKNLEKPSFLLKYALAYYLQKICNYNHLQKICNNMYLYRKQLISYILQKVCTTIAGAERGNFRPLQSDKKCKDTILVYTAVNNSVK